MAVTVADPVRGIVIVNTTLGNANIATKFILPSGRFDLTFKFRANAGKFATEPTLADGADITTASYMTIPAETFMELVTPHGGAVIYLAGDINATVAELVLMRRED